MKYFYKINEMAAGGHFGCPKFTFDDISGHFRSIRNFFLNFRQNDCRQPFWLSEIHFRSHFGTFQINTKLFLNFFYKWPAAPILDVRNSLSIAFLAISDRYATLIFLNFFDKMAAVGHFGCQKFTFDHISGHLRSKQNLIFL